jgi:hypothetical protein
MNVDVLEQHRWLHRLLGEWRTESEMDSEPGQTPQVLVGREVVRLLGEAWVVCEGGSDTPGGGSVQYVMTLGYAPERQCYVGTWIGSVMTHLWIYEGWRDPDAPVLTLEAEGPAWTPQCQPIPGKTARYRDVITFLSDDHRTLTSSVLGEDGRWSAPFQTVHYRRTGPAT